MSQSVNGAATSRPAIPHTHCIFYRHRDGQGLISMAIPAGIRTSADVAELQEWIGEKTGGIGIAITGWQEYDQEPAGPVTEDMARAVVAAWMAGATPARTARQERMRAEWPALADALNALADQVGGR